MIAPNLTLLTDLYQLTMAYGYWKKGMGQRESVFHLFFRRHPFKGNHTIACGLQNAIEYLKNLNFGKEDIAYLATIKSGDEKPLFSDDFLDYLLKMEFQCDVDAVPEGTLVFPHQPLLRIKGPLIQAQLIETALLNIINFSTLIATKASRIVRAAAGDTVLEFGLRRAQGPNGAISASRAAYIGGCHATSNVLAGKMYDIPVKGTHAHSWVMCFDSELEAFQTYADAMPGNCIFLVDTYDTEEGVANAIKMGQSLRKRGYEMAGIRLDSGDLSALGKLSRQMLDDAGFPNAKIVASNDLDEYRIHNLKEKDSKITVWGVGTRLATAFDEPALGGVYKLAAIRDDNQQWDYKVKLSEQAIKVSNPGILNVLRIENEDRPEADVIFNEEFPSLQHMISFSAENIRFSKDKGKLLLQPIFRKGKCIYQQPSIHDIRKRTLCQLDLFDNIENYPVGLEKELHELKNRLIATKK